MKVLHVITGLSAGGAETQLGLLLEHARHTPEVIALYNVGQVGQQMAERGYGSTTLTCAATARCPAYFA